MKKLLLPLLSILFFISCKKEIVTDKAQEEIATATANRTAPKITICHHDALTGKNKTIEINETAWPEHRAHGDLQGGCSDVIVTICGKDWMKKNLDVDKYKDGTSINGAIDYTSGANWIAATTGAWCRYNNNSLNGTVYGKLYNWYAVTDPKGLAPAGWHVPSAEEWNTLNACLVNEVAGGKMKSTGTIEASTGLWHSPNTGATNSSGFTGLPGGGRGNDGLFGNIGTYGIWWSSSQFSSSDAFVRLLGFDISVLVGFPYTKNGGFSVRCVRD